MPSAIRAAEDKTTDLAGTPLTPTFPTIIYFFNYLNDRDFVHLSCGSTIRASGFSLAQLTLPAPYAPSF
jgi:hypothetical protein